jgi:hypothetical protein
MKGLSFLTKVVKVNTRAKQPGQNLCEPVVFVEQTKRRLQECVTTAGDFFP